MGKLTDIIEIEKKIREELEKLRTRGYRLVRSIGSYDPAKRIVGLSYALQNFSPPKYEGVNGGYHFRLAPDWLDFDTYIAIECGLDMGTVYSKTTKTSHDANGRLVFTPIPVNQEASELGIRLGREFCDRPWNNSTEVEGMTSERKTIKVSVLDRVLSLRVGSTLMVANDKIFIDGEEIPHEKPKPKKTGFWASVWQWIKQ